MVQGIRASADGCKGFLGSGVWNNCWDLAVDLYNIYIYMYMYMLNHGNRAARYGKTVSYTSVTIMFMIVFITILL